jgi:putative peptide zinc metalloprotease protein
VNLEVITVRTVVPQQDIDLVRNATADVHVRLAENLAQVNDGHVKRIVPSASDRLPSPALGSQGGGQVALDPSDREGRKSMQKYFQIDVEMPSGEKLLNAGGRAHIRFDHGWAPIGVQWYRRARLLFLSRFNV